MLSNVSRTLTFACAALYAILGGMLFFFPTNFTHAFAYKVTPLMMMTIGAWDIGNAWLAYISARRWDWQLVSTSLLNLSQSTIPTTAVIKLTTSAKTYSWLTD